jgi:hypothetical protein
MRWVDEAGDGRVKTKHEVTGRIARHGSKQEMALGGANASIVMRRETSRLVSHANVDESAGPYYTVKTACAA